MLINTHAGMLACVQIHYQEFIAYSLQLPFWDIQHNIYLFLNRVGIKMKGCVNLHMRLTSYSVTFTMQCVLWVNLQSFRFLFIYCDSPLISWFSYSEYTKLKSTFIYLYLPVLLKMIDLAGWPEQITININIYCYYIVPW